MKKIMFNDRFGLTDVVLEGRKTVTRRIITPQPTYSEMSGINWKGYAYGIGSNNPTDAYRNFITGTEYSKSCNRYRVGEVLAVAQCYDTIIGTLLEPNGMVRAWIPESAGYRNKMFVKAELMPHQIEIIDVRAERLQDITDEDCIKEGMVFDDSVYSNGLDGIQYLEPRAAYKALINSIDGKDTWDNNPWVWVYDYELIDRKEVQL